MTLHVTLQRAQMCEPHSTYGAIIWFLTGVHTHVHTQVTRLCELLVADAAMPALEARVKTVDVPL
jgi:hypothetical protein